MYCCVMYCSVRELPIQLVKQHSMVTFLCSIHVLLRTVLNLQRQYAWNVKAVVSACEINKTCCKTTSHGNDLMFNVFLPGALHIKLKDYHKQPVHFLPGTTGNRFIFYRVLFKLNVRL